MSLSNFIVISLGQATTRCHLEYFHNCLPDLPASTFVPVVQSTLNTVARMSL